ncbi:MAG: hypothetical protein ACP5J4_17230 [Anaerolineae bacterium]
MDFSKVPNWLRFAVALILAALFFTVFTGSLANASREAKPYLRPLAAPGDVIEVFTNTWSYSTIGMVYDPDRGIVRYAHESQSSRHTPTIYDVDLLDHTVPLSFALSTQNPGWPWQIDNRTGAGYDYVAGTYFLPDYNGDLSYADDNIVEIDANGNILNAWEMDNEIGSNDSSDGSKIDTIIDIAVAPGNPTRYFVAAAYDGNRVYEIALQKTGTLWTPNSWSTVATYTLPIWAADNDNLGIDYNAENGYLYHSSWDTTTILITDLSMNVVTDIVTSFDCAGNSTYNSGVTFIEGAGEVWVTDFSSDQTTRCEAPSVPLPPTGWDKVVDGTTWTAGLSITTETSDTFQVTDVITAGLPFTLVEAWDAAHLTLLDVNLDPPLVTVVTGTGTLTVTGNAATPDTITVTKHFTARPCTWTQTHVSETLDIEDTLFEERPFTVTKRTPELHITSDYEPDVYAGSAAKFTLTYTNTGGFENDVVITNTFPVTAPFIYSDPAPHAFAPDRSWARWDIGNLAMNDGGTIDVYVYISETLTSGTEVNIWDGLYNHVGAVADEVTTTFTVLGEAAAGWTKIIDGGDGPVEWSPTFSLTLETGDIFTVTDVIDIDQAFMLVETWLTAELTLAGYDLEDSGGVEVDDSVSGTLILTAIQTGPLPPARPSGAITLTKVFTVNTCSWPQTILGEALQIGLNRPLIRPVLIHKDMPILALTASNPITEIHGGEFVTYTLTYANTGGYENAFSVQSDFPAEAPLAWADPAPTTGAAGDLTAEWVFNEGLTTGQSGMLTVTVHITDDIPPATRLEVINTLSDHTGMPRDVAIVTYEAVPPEWEKRVNDDLWNAAQSTPVEAGDIVTVSEVITTEADFILVDRWAGDHLTLLDATPGDGSVVAAAGRLTWTVTVAGPETVTLTKRFRVEAFTPTHTVLWEDLHVGGVEWEKRPVLLERAVPDLRLTKTVTPTLAEPGDAVTYTLTFSNAGPGTATGVVITDHIPVSVTVGTVISSGVHITDTGATSPYVWQVADLGANDGGVITLTGTLNDPLPASLVTNVAEIAADNDVGDLGTSPGGSSFGPTTDAAYIAVDGTPLVCTINDPVSGTTYAFCNGICGGITFANTGTVSSLTITFTQRYPSINGEGLPRQYQLDANDGSGFDARLTLCYADGELDIAGIAASEERALRGFRYAGSGVWTTPGAQTVNIEDNTITIEGVTEFSAWGIGIPETQQPTAVKQRTDLSGLRNLTGLGGILLALGMAILVRRTRKRRET